MSDITTNRPHKGKSLLLFPADYTVVDIETTGLDPCWDEIIELSALRVRSGEVCGRFSTLVKPENKISDFITSLTGIANEDVADAPTISEALPDFLGFVGADIIVGHNVHFDVNFIYDAAAICSDKPVTNDIVDTMRLARHILPQLKHHRLHDVADALGVDSAGAHRGLVDCEMTHSVLHGLRAVADLSGIDLTAIAATHGVRAANITAEPGKERPDSPLYGKICVFTGALERMQRKEAIQLVVNLGGTCGDNVTAKTNFLILGNNDYCTTIKDGKSTKQKKAEALILKGNDLQILSETAFYDMISEESPSGVTSAEAGNKKESSRKVGSFGCCGRYEACSDARECIHPDAAFALGCGYRQNLLAGRIFYGKNKNIK